MNKKWTRADSAHAHQIRLALLVLDNHLPLNVITKRERKTRRYIAETIITGCHTLAPAHHGAAEILKAFRKPGVGFIGAINQYLKSHLQKVPPQG